MNPVQLEGQKHGAVGARLGGYDLDGTVLTYAMRAAPYGGRAGFGTYNHDTLCVISALVSCGWWAAPAGARLIFRCIFSGGRPDSIKRIFSPSRDLQQVRPSIMARSRGAC